MTASEAAGGASAAGQARGRTALALRHLAFEDLGHFAPVLEGAGYEVAYVDVGLRDFKNLDPLGPELLFVLGGPIGANDLDDYPFLTDELRLLETRLAAGRATFGICLGAQLMARALGARVFAAPAKEIGFGQLQLSEAGRAGCLAALEAGPVLHWHGDTFDLPDGAVRLASTPICENQAFAYGRHALATQFHPEAAGEGFERWLVGHTLELSLAGVSVKGLRAEHARLADGLAERARRCLRTWLETVG